MNSSLITVPYERKKIGERVSGRGRIPMIPYERPVNLLICFLTTCINLRLIFYESIKRIILTLFIEKRARILTIIENVSRIPADKWKFSYLFGENFFSFSPFPLRPAVCKGTVMQFIFWYSGVSPARCPGAGNEPKERGNVNSVICVYFVCSSELMKLRTHPLRCELYFYFFIFPASLKNPPFSFIRFGR